MIEYRRTVPGDPAILPNMHTLPADRSESYVVHYIPNVEYVNRDGTALHLQLLMPDGLFPGMKPTYRYPLVVYVQGAAWGEQEMFMNIPQLCEVARAGFVVASVKHRASSAAKFPAFLQDVKSAIRFLRANAELYCIDPNQAAIWGDSSGGHAAQMVGVTGDMEEFKTDDNRDQSDAVGAVIDFYGPSDVTKINDGPRNPAVVGEPGSTPEDILFGGNVIEHPEISIPGNPVHYITKDKPLPPFLIVHGDHDPLVPFQQSVVTVKALQETGHVVEFYKVVGGEHGTFLWTKEVMKTVVSFLNAYFSR